jgi:hypothetical protein
MNHVDPPSFAERLMKSEPGNDELRRRYEEGKLALMERRLTPLHRWPTPLSRANWSCWSRLAPSVCWHWVSGSFACCSGEAA